jgi:hypothetical protein
MGHTLPPLTMQFKAERQLFEEMRRALLLREDQALFADLWDRAEFHVPAADRARHPLPIASILLCLTLEQEKALYQAGQKEARQDRRIQELEKGLKEMEGDNLLLRGEIETLRAELEEFRAATRQEVLELLYPSYVP